MASLERLDHLLGQVHRAQDNHRDAERKRLLAALAAEAMLLASGRRVSSVSDLTPVGALQTPQNHVGGGPRPA